MLCASRSLWQNAYIDRLIGSKPQECLDHEIFYKWGLRRILRSISTITLVRVVIGRWTKTLRFREQAVQYEGRAAKLKVPEVERYQEYFKIWPDEPARMN